MAQHELVEQPHDGGGDSDGETGSLEKFLTEVHTEAKEIYEGAKNFAKNAVRYQDGSEKKVDPATIHENFDSIYGWTQMRYELQLYDIDIVRLE